MNNATNTLNIHGKHMYHIIHTITAERSKLIRSYLSRSSCQREDEVITETATFPDGARVDFECYVRNVEDSSPNVRAVLYGKNGKMRDFCDAEDFFEGEWELESDDTIYRVTVNSLRETIYTHDEAARITELFEDILEKYNIRIPSPEDDERDPDDVGLYGVTYANLLDDIEDALLKLLNQAADGARIVPYEFSGKY